MTIAGTNIDQRSIILVPFPFSDLAGSKKRPALVISNTEFNRRNDDIICCLVTSNPTVKNAIKITNNEMESGFLEFEIGIKLHRLCTVSKSIIYKVLCRLNKEKSQLVIDEIDKLIELK